MDALIWILLSTFMVSLISFLGILTLIINDRHLEKIVMALVALSAGALMGGAFLHLIPEAVEKFSDYNIFIYILVGFVVFFFIEKILHWRHCHLKKCPIHTFAYMNLFGDAVHNFIDGMIIAASFCIDIPLGIATTLAVAIHEIPQEIGDFGVLIYGGFSKFKALFWNFICALTAVFGGVFGYFLSGHMESSTIFLLPFAAGGFIYIAASDLIPEIRKETNLIKSLITFGTFILGIGLMLAVKLIMHG
ncbi:MAG: ZIP family metal transporter [Candidatus Diapherotrites archaeon]